MTSLEDYSVNTSAGPLIAKSEKMRKIINVIHRIANVDSTVLLLGESGVGKTMLAKYVHQQSMRHEQPFISINCSTLPENLIESELFGYEPGSFTGGKREGKTGLIESAEGGTLFLDEIAELPFAAQSKLLEVIQENKYRKIGSIHEKAANIRIIAATNKNLKELVQKKGFREDLYYRLYVVPLMVPPLRERHDEIPYLSQYFVQKFNQKYHRQFNLSSLLMEKFQSYNWPGNIRELENTIEQIVVTQSDQTGESWLLTDALTDTVFLSKEHILPLKQAKQQFEKELILRVYHLYKSTYKAAEVLQVDQSTIAKKLKKYREEEKKGVKP
ncbi:sigma 54-interacting transcriptional regulator [Pseudobacillus sp. FSL P4-0506]|uniref:sigma-54 interaction domain-containing protein n=1 Tax=unclassified Pseudobacillus TaxID=2619284 RepID=UPI0030F9FD66